MSIQNISAVAADGGGGVPQKEEVVKINYAKDINRTLRLINGQYLDIQDLK